MKPWILFVFPHMAHTLTNLYLCYAISWVLNIVFHLVTVHVLNLLKKRAARSMT